MVRHSTVVSESPATQAGALDGHQFICTCGERQTTSLSAAEAERMAAKHLTWHETQAAV